MGIILIFNRYINNINIYIYAETLFECNGDTYLKNCVAVISEKKTTEITFAM